MNTTHASAHIDGPTVVYGVHRVLLDPCSSLVQLTQHRDPLQGLAQHLAITVHHGDVGDPGAQVLAPRVVAHIADRPQCVHNVVLQAASAGSKVGVGPRVCCSCGLWRCLYTRQQRKQHQSAHALGRTRQEGTATVPSLPRMPHWQGRQAQLRCLAQGASQRLESPPPCGTPPHQAAAPRRWHHTRASLRSEQATVMEGLGQAARGVSHDRASTYLRLV